MVYRKWGLKAVWVALLSLALGLGAVDVVAQSETLSLTMSAEQDIGFECPVRAALDPSETSVWVLMAPCYERGYTLRVFDVDSGEPLNDDEHAYREALAVLDGSYADFASSLAVMPDGALSLIYSDSEYNMLRLTIAAGSDGSAETESETDDSLGNLLADYAEYPETTVFNADHTRAVAIGTDRLHVLDLQTGTELLAIEMPGLPDNAYASFSQDGQHLYVTQLNNVDDMTDYSSTISVYSLADGELLGSYDVPSFLLWVSPNGQQAVARIGSNDGTSEDMLLVDLADNSMSTPLSVFEPPHPVTTCLNNGNDVSDVDFTATGRLWLSDLLWLPDSSGFITLNSYGGEGSGGSSVCIFNYSRLRHYIVQHED